MHAVEQPRVGRKPCMSGWKVMPLMRRLCIIVVISFHMLLSSPIPRTLPGSALGISTRMLQWSSVGSSPVRKASWTMFTIVSHGVGFCLHPSHHAFRLPLVMPLGPGDLPERRLVVASDILVLSGMSSRMLNRQRAWMGFPSGGICW